MSYSTRIRLLILAAAAVLMTTAAPAQAQSHRCDGVDAIPSTIDQETFDDTILCLLNQERAKRGLVQLRSNGKLADAAGGHSSSMRWGGYFSHDEPDGSTFASRIQQAGYLKRARRWLVGENIAWGSSTLGTPRSLITAWMNSPPHRENILERRYRQIGVGLEWGTPSNANLLSGVIVTTDFGFVKKGNRRH